MGDAIEILMTEHAAIQQAMAVLGRICEQAARGPADNHAQRAGQALEFLSEFADRCHNAKTEQLLFPALARRGMLSDRGPVAAQLAGHRQGRQLLDAMTRTQLAWASGARSAGARFSAAATAYHALMDRIIPAEHDVVFTAADRLLDPVTQHALAHAFGQFDAQVLGTTRRVHLSRQLDALVADYAPVAGQRTAAANRSANTAAPSSRSGVSPTR